MKSVVIRNVKGLLSGERSKVGFHVLAKVNAHGFVTLYHAGTAIRLETSIRPTLEDKLGRLARRACANGQEIVDWTAL